MMSTVVISGGVIERGDEPLQVPLNRAAFLLGVCRQTLYRIGRMPDDGADVRGEARPCAALPATGYYHA